MSKCTVDRIKRQDKTGKCYAFIVDVKIQTVYLVSDRIELHRVF